MNYLIITENDESQWDDKTGEYYHFPSRYKNKLTEGSKIIYYTGKRKNKNFVRLSNDPHYFGIATIGKIEEDLSDIEKKSFYAKIQDYQPFIYPVGLKDKDGSYLENVINKNHFRDGVRLTSEEIYIKIISEDNLLEKPSIYDDSGVSFSSYGIEGRKKVIYTTVYEREAKLRSRAIEIHGTICKCCNFNFEKSYGDLGKDFIHVHHIKPISESGETIVNPQTDLVVLCPNCHYMIHRKRNHTPSVDELKSTLLHMVNY